MESAWKKAIVVGGTGGLGKALAARLKQGGCDVAIMGRTEEKVDQIVQELGLPADRGFTFDILEFDQAWDAFDAVVQKLAGVDLFIFAAGVMPNVSQSEYNIEKDKVAIDTNLTAAMAMCNVAAKRFERVKGGTIIGIGSPSGDRGRRGNPAYGASKAGFEAYLESLRNRLGKANVSVVTAKPGPIRTQMTEPLGKLPGMIDPDKAAEIILRKGRRFSKTFYVPGKWWLAAKIMRLIPSFIFRRLNI
jgi:short-subunit dehydrogenase